MNSTASKHAAPVLAGMRAVRADARRNRARVLKAARRRFAEDGLDAQMDDIAKAAGVGVGTVYRHFPTKEDLLDALIADRFERIAQWTREALEQEDAWEAFRELIHRSAELQASDRALSEALASRAEKMHEVAVSSGVYELTERLVARAKECGGMRPDAVVEDVPTIICGLGRVVHAAGGEKTISWQRFLAILLDGLRAGPDRAELPPRHE